MFLDCLSFVVSVSWFFACVLGVNWLLAVAWAVMFSGFLGLLCELIVFMFMLLLVAVCLSCACFGWLVGWLVWVLCCLLD